jgi:Flp pilus assembly pilin Flp
LEVRSFNRVFGRIIPESDPGVVGVWMTINRPWNSTKPRWERLRFGKGGNPVGTEGATAMWLLSKNVLKGRKGQHLLEYAMVAAIIGSAVIAMSTYVYRAVQGTQQAIHNEFR